MRNVLIVDDERQFIDSLLVGLGDYEDVFRVTAASNGKEAIGILNRTRVDLVVTDLRMPEVNGFELLAHLSSHYPSIPAFVLSAYASADTEERLARMGTVKFFEKPIDFDQFVKSILNVFEKDLESGSLDGVSVASFIQLVEMENKTCLLKVESEKDKKGFFYFNCGELYDAACRGLKGEDAAVEMIGWERVRISFKAVPVRKVIRRIQKRVMPLIVASVKKSEAREESTVKRGGENTVGPRKSKRRATSGEKRKSKEKKGVANEMANTGNKAPEIVIIGGLETGRSVILN